MDEPGTETQTRQERRHGRADAAKARVRKSGRGLGRVYRDALLKRLRRKGKPS